MNQLTNLVQLGFHGAAVAVLILAYRLLGKWIGSAPGRPDVEKSRAALIRQFIGLCWVLLSVGVTAQLLAPVLPTVVQMLGGETRLTIHSRPKVMPLNLGLPKIASGLSEIDGEGELRARAGDIVSIDVQALTTEIERQDFRLRDLEGHSRKEANDVGIDNP